MIFFFQIRGFGVLLQILHFDAVQFDFVILSWNLYKDYQVWRGERHSRYHESGGYQYKCTKNGKVVEDISFRSPIVNHV